MTLNFPKRITPPAPVGSMLKRGADLPQQRVFRAEPRKDDPDYLALVRQCPCLYCGLDPCGEAAHVRFASAIFGKSSGMGRKPADENALPLCGEDHRLAMHAQHNHNERAWWEAIGIQPYIVTDQLYRQRGDLVAMRAVCFVAIANRDRK
jgi:hypothetical protein